VEPIMKLIAAVLVERMAPIERDEGLSIQERKDTAQDMAKDAIADVEEAVAQLIMELL